MNTMNSSEKDHSVFESCLIKKRKKKKNMHCYTNLYAVFQCKIFNQKILIINKKNSSVIRFIMSICHFYDFLKINQMNAIK